MLFTDSMDQIKTDRQIIILPSYRANSRRKDTYHKKLFNTKNSQRSKKLFVLGLFKYNIGKNLISIRNSQL